MRSLTLVAVAVLIATSVALGQDKSIDPAPKVSFKRVKGLNDASIEVPVTWVLKNVDMDPENEDNNKVVHEGPDGVVATLWIGGAIAEFDDHDPHPCKVPQPVPPKLDHPGTGLKPRALQECLFHDVKGIAAEYRPEHKSYSYLLICSAPIKKWQKYRALCYDISTRVFIAGEPSGRRPSAGR